MLEERLQELITEVKRIADALEGKTGVQDTREFDQVVNQNPGPALGIGTPSVIPETTTSAPQVAPQVAPQIQPQLSFEQITTGTPGVQQTPQVQVTQPSAIGFDELARATRDLHQKNPQKVMGLLQHFNISGLTALDKSRYEEFANLLRIEGVSI